MLTLIMMQRGRYNTVTRMPVLIPADRGTEQGEATFAGEFGYAGPVRELRSSDLKGAASVLTKFEALHFPALLMLREAFQNRDRLGLENAWKRLLKAYEVKRKEYKARFPEKERPEESFFSLEVARWMQLPPEQTREAMEVYEGVRIGPQVKSSYPRLLSAEMSKAVKEARLVLWWNDGRFSPALWCPDLKTAFYTRALLDLVVAKGFRICIYCGQPFFQDRGDQAYCCIAHREAHRVARWRAKKKQEKTAKIEKQSKRKRREHGTRKAR